MKALSLLTVILFLLAGCASDQARYDSDKDSPSYWSGSPAQSPTNLNGYQNYNPPAVDAGEAVAGIIGAGTFLAMNRNYYKHSAITGRVVCRGEGKNDMEIPCGRVDVVIVNGKGTEVGRTQTEGDNFAFKVKSNTTYHLKIDSKKYVMTPIETPDLQLGDDVILRLSLR